MIWGDSTNVGPELLDDDTAERLLGGAVHPDDAPPGFEPVARLLTLARSPGGEEDSEAATVARMVEVIVPAGPSPAERPALIRRLLTVKLAAVAGAVLLSTGAAAATGSLPGSLQDTLSEAVSHVGLDLPGAATDHADVGGKPAGSSGRAGSGQTGRPDAPGSESGGSETSTWVQEQVHDIDGAKGPVVAPCVSGGHAQAGVSNPGDAGEGGDAEATDCPLPVHEPSGPEAGNGRPGDGGAPPGDPGTGQEPVDGKVKAGEASGGASTAGPENSRRP